MSGSTPGINWRTTSVDVVCIESAYRSSQEGMTSSKSRLLYRMLAGAVVTAVAFSDARPNSDLTSYWDCEEPAATASRRNTAARHIWAPRQLGPSDRLCTNIWFAQSFDSKGARPTRRGADFDARIGPLGEFARSVSIASSILASINDKDDARQPLADNQSMGSYLLCDYVASSIRSRALRVMPTLSATRSAS